MKSFKVLCLCAETYGIGDYFHENPLIDDVACIEEAQMKVLEFKHEDMDKNQVTLTQDHDGFTYSIILHRALDGKLYHVREYLTRMNLIHMME